MRQLRYLGFITRLAVCLLLAAACGQSRLESGLQPDQPHLTAPPATRTSRSAPTATASTRHAAPTATDRPAQPACTDARDISIDHVGQLPCVTGTVDRAYNTSEASYVDLSAAFYLLAYDGDLSGIVAGSCLAMRGEI